MLMMRNDVLQAAACFICIVLQFVEGHVIELDDRFLQARHEGNWLVQFYAPWCGYCKRLAPIWSEVGSALSYPGSNIRVAKVDCTRYSSVADEFNVRGFPTIKFIRGDKVYNHQGSRTKEDIVQFAERAKGPAVKHLKSRAQFYNAKSQNDLFFLYAGSDENCPVYEKYHRIAEDKVIGNSFYACKPDVLPSDYKIKDFPAVVVFKDGTYFTYQAADDLPTMGSILEWINAESLPAFIKITSSNLHEIAASGKLLVLGVFDEKETKSQYQQNRLRTLLEQMALHHRETYHRDFQFSWMDGPEAINNIIMSSVNVPSIVVLDPLTQHYYKPGGQPNQITLQSMSTFLTQVKNGTAVAYGGNGIIRRIYRVFYEFISSAVNIWLDHPIITSLVVSIPTLMITFMCYTICTTETYDEDEMDEDEEEDEEDESRGALDPSGRLAELQNEEHLKSD